MTTPTPCSATSGATKRSDPVARGTLHAPKPDDQRRRRNAPTLGGAVVYRDGATRGPALESLYPAVQWSPLTLGWWEVWRQAPQAALFEATDWMRLAIMAPLVEEYIQAPNAAALKEIRMNEAQLGALHVDRLRARITITDPDDGAIAGEAQEAAPARPASGRAAIAARLETGA